MFNKTPQVIGWQHDDIPEWMYESVIENILPWDKSVRLEIESFLAQYTLHDSYWIGVYSDIAYENTSILIINWDPAWLPKKLQRKLKGRPTKSGYSFEENLYLFIKLEEVKNINMIGYKDIGGSPRSISNAEFIKEEEMKCFNLTDDYGGQVLFEYCGNSYVLALKRNKEIIRI
jgi:hypothetical protein